MFSLSQNILVIHLYYFSYGQVFWCNNTGLESIPNEISNCKLLHTFGARGNRISKLPDEFGLLENLRLVSFCIIFILSFDFQWMCKCK